MRHFFLPEIWQFSEFDSRLNKAMPTDRHSPS